MGRGQRILNRSRLRPGLRGVAGSSSAPSDKASHQKPIDTHASPCLNVASVLNSNHYTNMTTQATATINNRTLIPVTRSLNWNRRVLLTVSVPTGWKDVQEICDKVLTLPDDSRTYTFTGWDSAKLVAYFQSGLAAHAR